MFNAPEIIKNIPDISTIYGINERQGNELDGAVERINNNLYFDSMDEETIEKEELIFEIVPSDGDTLDTRRMKVKAKELENKNYTYRQLIKSLRALLPNGYNLKISNDRTQVVLNINQSYSASQIKALRRFLDNFLPLNIIFEIISNFEIENSQLSSCVYVQTGEIRTLQVGADNRNYPLIAVAGDSLVIAADDDIIAEESDGHLVVTAEDLVFTAENGHIYCEREE